MIVTTVQPDLDALYAEVNRAFHFFNDLHWDSSLPVPLFTFNPQPPNGRRLGHFCPNVWATEPGTAENDRQDEIVFYSDLCLERGIEQVLQTLLHEMVHLWQHYYGRKKSKTVTHNKEWHEEAARVGLHTEGPKGTTTPTPLFDKQLIDFAADTTVPFRIRAVKKAGKMKKWTCECGVNVRVGRKEFKALCLNCDSEFTSDEGDND